MAAISFSASITMFCFLHLVTMWVLARHKDLSALLKLLYKIISILLSETAIELWPGFRYETGQ